MKIVIILSDQEAKGDVLPVDIQVMRLAAGTSCEASESVTAANILAKEIEALLDQHHQQTEDYLNANAVQAARLCH